MPNARSPMEPPSVDAPYSNHPQMVRDSPEGAFIDTSLVPGLDPHALRGARVGKLVSRDTCRIQQPDFVTTVVQAHGPSVSLDRGRRLEEKAYGLGPQFGFSRLMASVGKRVSTFAWSKR